MLKPVELPADIMEKAKIIGNVFDDIKLYKGIVEEIDEIVSGDWGYSVTDDMVDLNTTESHYRKFTQKQAEEMATAIGRIYMKAHVVHCDACMTTRKNKPANPTQQEDI